MLAWSEGTDNGRQKTRNHGYDVIVGGELFTDYSDHPRKLVTLNPKLKSTGAGRYQLLPTGCLPQAVWPERLLSESQDAVALQQITERGYLWLIVVISGQAIDRCNIWASLPGAGYGQFEHKADSSIAKFKEAVNGQRDWCGGERVRLAIIPFWLSALSSACHGLLIITVITPLPTKPSATKMPENWKLANAAITDMQMRVSVMLLRSMQKTKSVSWC